MGWKDIAGESKPLDALKVAVGIVIAVYGAIIENNIKTQTQALERHTAGVREAMDKRQQNVDLTFKLYETATSERLACFDESKSQMLKALVDTNNEYNKIKVQYADIANSLMRHALEDEKCPAHKAASAIRGTLTHVPTATSAPGASHKNAHIKAAVAETSKTLREKDAGQTLKIWSEADVQGAGDGWVSLGRYNEGDGYAHFKLLEPLTQDEKSLQIGVVVQARHVVYLRGSHTDVILTENPILAVVSEDTCVRIEQFIPHLRGSTWARVTLMDDCADQQEMKRTAERS